MTTLFWYPGYELLLENVVRAENCHLFDAAGKRYVDLESGVWCTSIGHGHPRILRVMKDQAGRIGHTGFSYSSAIVAKASKEVLALHGFSGGMCIFLCSGSEAVEFGVRVAQAVNMKPMLMTMADSYFGAYGAASTRPVDEWYTFDWTACAECHDESMCNEKCVHWASIPFERIGGFLFEPGSSSGLVRFPPDKLIRQIVKILKANNGLVIINEVTTGIGRTGKWFGYQHYDISPDIVAMGKGIGNGYPVSATAFSPDLVGKLRGKQIKYAQSHQNDPLGAAIALEVIRTIRNEGLLEKGKRIGERLTAGLAALQDRTEKIKEIRARGLMLAIELRDDPTAAFTAFVQKELVRRGYIVARRPDLNVLRIDPSLTVASSDIEDFLKDLSRILSN